MKILVNPESATAEFSSFVSCVFFVVGAWVILLHISIFQFHCKLYHLYLLYNVFDYIPCLYFILSSIHVPCCSVIQMLGLLVWPSSCAQHSSSCICLMWAGYLWCIHVTKSNFCCYIYFLSDILATVVSVFCRMHMVVLSYWILLLWWVELLSQHLGCTIPLSEIKYGIPSALIEWTGYHSSSSASWNLHHVLLLTTQNSWKHPLFCHGLHFWRSHNPPLFTFVQALPCPGRPPGNAPWTAPMCNH